MDFETIMFYRKIGVNIRNLRTDYRYSINDLSTTLKISPSLICQIELGNRRVSVSDLYKISKALSTPMEAIIEGKDDTVSDIYPITNFKPVGPVRQIPPKKSAAKSPAPAARQATPETQARIAGLLDTLSKQATPEKCKTVMAFLAEKYDNDITEDNAPEIIQDINDVLASAVTAGQ